MLTSEDKKIRTIRFLLLLLKRICQCRVIRGLIDMWFVGYIRCRVLFKTRGHCPEVIVSHKMFESLVLSDLAKSRRNGRRDERNRERGKRPTEDWVDKGNLCSRFFLALTFFFVLPTDPGDRPACFSLIQSTERLGQGEIEIVNDQSQRNEPQKNHK